MRLTPQRRKSGNVLVLVSVSMGLLGVGLICGLSFCGLFLAQALLQNFANEAALQAACKLNGGNQSDFANGVNPTDRIGQMNNIIARSRAAVYESRKNFDEALNQSANSSIEALADQLYQSARDGAKTIEPERQNLKDVAQTEAIDEVQQQIAQISKFKLILPWIQVNSPRLEPGDGVTFGQIKDIHSNVMQLDEANKLKNYDQSNGYVHSNNRYKANQNAKLPGADSDLDFKFSSLQPPVKTEVSPARLVLPSAFEDVPTGDSPQGDIPSTVKVTMIMDVSTQLGVALKRQIKVVGIATTSGGSVMR